MPNNAVSVATGSNTVTGELTVFVAAENDVFLAGGAVALIKSRPSPTQLLLWHPWRGPSLSGEVAWSILPLGEHWRSEITTNQKIQTLIELWENAGPLKFDAAGTLAERAQYNGQPKGFVYLAVSPLPWTLYLKLRNTNSASDWSAGQPIGDGGEVEYQASLTLERNERTAADAQITQTLTSQGTTLTNLGTRLTAGETSIADHTTRLVTLEKFDPVIFLDQPIIVEDDYVLVPTFFAYDDESFRTVAPANGAYYFSYFLGGFNSGVWQLQYNDGVLTQVIGAVSDYTTRGTTIILDVSNGQVTSPYATAGRVGKPPNPNQCSFSLDARGAQRRFGSTLDVQISVNLADTNLTNQGMNWGVADPTGKTPYYGDDLAGARLGQRMFVRVYVKTSVPNSFGTAMVYVFDTASGQVTQRALQIEAMLTSTLRIYSLSFLLPYVAYDAAWFWVGVEGLGSTSTIVQLQGLQYHCSSDPALWIMRSDLPAREGRPISRVPSMLPLYSSDMFLVSGRKMPLYPTNLMRERNEADTFTTTFYTQKAAAADYPQVLSEKGDTILIDPDMCGTWGGIEIRQHGGTGVRQNKRYRMPLNIHVAPARQSGTLRILYIGDSVSNRGAVAMLRDKLVAMNIQTTMIGTMNNRGAFGEAREGWSFSDFTGQRVRSSPLTPIQPVAAGSESTYSAYADDGTGQTTQKLSFNPFLKVATQADINALGAFIFNGMIFDPRFYLNRFGFADPDIVFINLGQNDVAFAPNAATALDWIQKGEVILYNQLRRDLPNAYIVFVLNTQPRSHEGDVYWNPQRVDQIIGEILRYRALVTDNKLFVLPAWAHMSQEVGWPTSLLRVNSDGVQVRQITDGVHPDILLPIAQSQLAEVTSAFAACVKAGAVGAGPNYTGGWTAFSPLVTAETPGATPPTFTITDAAYLLDGKVVHWRARIVVTAAGTGTGRAMIRGPFVAKGDSFCSGHENTATGKGLVGLVTAGSNIFYVRQNDLTTPIITGAVLIVGGTYEAA